MRLKTSLTSAAARVATD